VKQVQSAGSVAHEEWRAIPGNEGYEVSSEGRVRSINRTLPDGRRWCGRIMKQRTTRHGYKSITLATGSRGRGRTAHVHTLVAEAFLGVRPTAHHLVAHGDGSRTNNRPDNLRWATALENAEDRDRHGTTVRLKGEAYGMSRLTAAAVLEMRARKHRGASADELAERFRVSRWTVFDAVSGRTWGHV